MKYLKFKSLATVALLAATLSFTSCATVFGGKVTEHQRTKPVAGEPSRKVRVAALIVDALFGVVPLIVDFATGAIYKPQR